MEKIPKESSLTQEIKTSLNVVLEDLLNSIEWKIGIFQSVKDTSLGSLRFFTNDEEIEATLISIFSGYVSHSVTIELEAIFKKYGMNQVDQDGLIQKMEFSEELQTYLLNLKKK